MNLDQAMRATLEARRRREIWRRILDRLVTGWAVLSWTLVLGALMPGEDVLFAGWLLFTLGTLAALYPWAAACRADRQADRQARAAADRVIKRTDER